MFTNPISDLTGVVTPVALLVSDREKVIAGVIYRVDGGITGA